MTAYPHFMGGEAAGIFRQYTANCDQIVNSDFPDTIYIDPGWGNDKISLMFFAKTLVTNGKQEIRNRRTET